MTEERKSDQRPTEQELKDREAAEEAAMTDYSTQVEYQEPYDAAKDQALDDLAEKYGGRRTASGMGWGYRDLEYEFGNEENMKAFLLEARPLIHEASE